MPFFSRLGQDIPDLPDGDFIQRLWATAQNEGLGEEARKRLQEEAGLLEELASTRSAGASTSRASYVATMLGSKLDALGRMWLVDISFDYGHAYLTWAGAQKHFYVLGNGYFGSDEESIFDSGSCEYKRTHTPDGVQPRSVGLGTALYSGLCLGAVTYETACGAHSVIGGRTKSAEKWWVNATKNNYALRHTLVGAFYEKYEEPSEITEYEEVAVDADDWFDFINGTAPELEVSLEDLVRQLDDTKYDDDGNELSLTMVSVPDSVIVGGRYRGDFNYIGMDRWGSTTIRFSRKSGGRLEIQAIYTGEASGTREVSATHTILLPKKVMESGFVLFGVQDAGTPADKRYGVAPTHSSKWLASESRRVNIPTYTGTFDDMYADDGSVEWSKVQAEFAARAYHGPSGYLVFAMLDAIARVNEDLAVAYGSRPDITQIVNADPRAAEVMTRLMTKKQPPVQGMRLDGIHGLSGAACREIYKQMGYAAMGQADLGPANNLLKLPPLSAAAKAKQSKLNFD